MPNPTITADKNETLAIISCNSFCEEFHISVTLSFVDKASLRAKYIVSKIAW